MASQANHTLSIIVEKDIGVLVKAAKYLPAVEILQNTPAVKLTRDEEIQWIELKNPPSFPIIFGQKEDEPVFVQDNDSTAGRIDVKFLAPNPDSKVIWFAFQTPPLPDHPELPAPHEPDPVQLETGELGKAFHIDEAGVLTELGEHDNDHGIRKKDSIGIINDTRLKLFFWILPKGSQKPDSTVDHQTFEWLPGSGRIQLPATAGEGLKIKVWLEAFSNIPAALGGITFQDQTVKTLVAYEPGATDKVVTTTELGLSSQAIPEPAPKIGKESLLNGPPTLSSKASLSRRLASSGTNGVRV